MTSFQKTTVSAPGKILLAGGYLVLEAPNVGFVIAADKRFYSTVEAADVGDGTNDNDEATIITVKSPQFHMEWEYSYNQKAHTLHASSTNPSVNFFVEKTLHVCLMYLTRQNPDVVLPSSLQITIKADNDFYSVLPHLPKKDDGSIDRTPSEVESLPPFLNCPLDDSGKAVVNKTGLGSSAALTTSLVGALVYFLLGSQQRNKEDDDDEWEERIHNLAQICHCHAQGKVGSGFDVSAACHGTHVYRRFPKCLLPDLMQQLEDIDSHENHNTDNLCVTLQRLVEMVPWKEDMVQKDNIALPKGQLQIMLADVRGGSESPSMAKTVLKWKLNATQHKDGGIPHWTSLSKLNTKVVEIMQQLVASPVPSPELDTLATLPASQWPKESPLTILHKTLCEIRKDLKDMGDAAGVPIEPPPQTLLCNATMEVPGVVAAVVPGAGGYDAIACVYVDRPSVKQAIGELWAQWKEPAICPLAVQACDGGLQLEE